MYKALWFITGQIIVLPIRTSIVFQHIHVPLTDLTPSYVIGTCGMQNVNLFYPIIGIAAGHQNLQWFYFFVKCYHIQDT